MKNSDFQFIVILLCLIAFNACVSSRTQNDSITVNSNTSQPEKTPDAEKSAVKESTTQQGEIRKVDFKNFTYEPFCAGEDKTKVTVKKGEYSEEKGEYERFYFNITDITYGDVSGDKDEDAIILTLCNTGGTGQFTEGFVYTLKDGKPALLTRIEGGDRAYGGLRSAKVQGDLLVVERNDVSENSGACCPEFAVTTKYKWNGSKLVESGKTERRELYPATTVSFEKGKSSTDITVNIPAGEIKRFSVGARAGQTLTVSGDSKKFSYGLAKGEADVQDNELGFVAKLSETGNFVIQIQNISEKDEKTVVRIQIK